MKVCIFGAGAIGGHVAVKLISSKVADVSLVARGPVLDAIRTRGLTLRSGGKDTNVQPAVATDDPSTLPQQDLVIVSLKATTLPAAAPAIARLIAPQGCALFLVNGIPWWWNHGRAGRDGALPLIDPQGVLWNTITPQKALGCVLYSPNEPEAPGVISHVGASRWVMGEPDGSSTARLAGAVDLFNRAGLTGEVTDDLRCEIWRKLVANASGNPLGALTQLTLGQIGMDPELRQLRINLMHETIAVAKALGWDITGEIDVPTLATPADRKPDVRSSMLQDVIAGRPLEIEAQLGQIQVFAREAGVPVPTMDVMLPLVRGLDRGLRCR